LAEVPATQTSYTNNTAAANTDYFYRVKAVSMSTIESGFSNEVTAHLQPDIAVTPLGITTTLNLAHNISLHSFSISNTGNYNLSYELSGTDTYAANPSLPAISGFTAMGIFNGHRYYRSNRTMTWTAAKTLCERSGGHLATITSAEENTFLSSSTRMWIGLTDEVTEGTYRWVTNEPYSYYNWATNQPDNSSGIEDYVEINFSGFLGTWNDNTNGTNLNAILEIETLPITSILSFTPSSGMIETTATQAIAMAINGAYLADGVYQTSVKITSDAPEPRDTIYIPVTVKVDYTPPTAPLGLVFDEAQSDMNQIYLSWTANTMADSVYSYKIFRRGVHDADWTLKGTVDADQLWFIDNQFTGLDTTAVYYKITAVDWVDNEGSASSEVLAWLQRFAAPTGLNISTLLGRHIHLQWSPVTQTISGAPGTPTCYLIYKSSTPLPLSEYDFLDIAETTEYTHRYATFFQPGNKLFYILTAYGGDVPGLRRMLANRRECKYGELEKILPETKR
jgi:hypothetical protein